MTRLIVVAGPRQTGKTTLVRQVLQKSHSEHEYDFVAIDEPTRIGTPGEPLTGAQTVELDPLHRDVRWLTLQWERARAKADRSERGHILVLDEIQKINRWSDAAKGLWDADRLAGRALHVVLLGSAPLLIQKGLVESLAGRFELIRVAHWSFREMSDAFGFDLPTYVFFGGYPGGALVVHDEQRWRDYILAALVEPNIHKDILMMTRVDKPALLRQLFELGCRYSGQELSYNKMVGQLQDAGNTTTLAHYLDLLAAAGLLAGLQKFAGRALRRRASSPKLNVLNTALMTAGSGYSFEQARADRSFWGRLVESSVGAHLLNTSRPEVGVHYWRDSPHEVDFVLARANRTVAIEVKSGLDTSGTRGALVFAERFRLDRTLIVGGPDLPLEEFLWHPATHWLD